MRQWPSGNMTTLAIDIITNHHHTACSATMQALGFFGFFFFISLSQIKAFHALNWAVNMVWKRECHVETGEKSHLTFLGTVMHQEKGGQWVREQRCAWNPSSLSSLLLSSPSNQGFFFLFCAEGERGHPEPRWYCLLLLHLGSLPPPPPPPHHLIVSSAFTQTQTHQFGHVCRLRLLSRKKPKFELETPSVPVFLCVSRSLAPTSRCTSWVLKITCAAQRIVLMPLHYYWASRREGGRSGWDTKSGNISRW